MAQPEVLERELPTDVGTLSIISKAEIDVQISTAHRFPRSVAQFQKDVMSLVSLNEQVAEECIYALPRDGKTIEGASARFGEIIAHAWGNCRAGARVVDDTGDFVTAQGVFHDLEKNVAITYEVQRRIVDKHGKRYKPDMIGVTANAACSIALRNAILKGVPKAFWTAAYDQARKVIMGDFQTLSNRRTAALDAFQKFGVLPQQIFDKLDIKGIEDITLEHILILRGLLTAVREGDTTVEEMFSKSVEMPKAKESLKPQASASETKQTASATPPAAQESSAPDTPVSQAAELVEEKKISAPAQKPAEKKADEKKSDPALTMAQKNIIKAKLKNAKLTVEQLEAKFGAIDKLTLPQFNDIQDWINNPA
jgi:hypothetical protein